MSILLFLKVFADASLVFSVLGAFPKLFVHSYSFLYPALLCGAGVGVASFLSQQGRYEVRFFGLVLPLASFALVGSVLDAVILLPAVLYSVLIIFKGDLTLEYYDFREVFTRSFTVWCVFFVLMCMFNGFEAQLDTEIKTFDYKVPFQYGLIYALCGIILLRQLRLGEDRLSQEKIMNNLQLIAVLGGLAAVILGIVVIERILQDSATSLITELSKGILTVVATPLMYLLRWLSKLFAVDSDSIKDFFEEKENSTQPTVMAPPPLVDESEDGVQNTNQDGFPWWLVGLFLILLVAVLLYLLKTFSKRAAVPLTEEKVSRIAPPQKDKREDRRSNRGKVRQYYREFLKAEKRNGVVLRSNQTSQDILDHISRETDHQSAAHLRQIYLEARYNEQTSISADDAKKAKTALKNCRKA